MLNKPVVFLILMNLVWLISNMLWIGLLLLLASALTGKSSWAGAGWAFFGAYWASQPGHYMEIEDFFNAFLAIGAAAFCFYLSWIMFSNRGSQASSWAGYAAAVCGLVYFPFAEVGVLNSWLIGLTTQVTVMFLKMFSVPVLMSSWNTMVLNGSSVEIVLACTAIESIALFAGIIISVNAPLGRRFFALAVSTLAIYILNVFRNAFVLVAYGEQWFGSGSESFFVAHNVIAKIGSTVALLILAYFVLSVLPELLKLIDDLFAEIRRPGGDAA
jgi:archaeosortase A (PGF-CTERM-specific)